MFPTLRLKAALDRLICLLFGLFGSFTTLPIVVRMYSGWKLTQVNVDGGEASLKLVSVRCLWWINFAHFLEYLSEFLWNCLRFCPFHVISCILLASFSALFPCHLFHDVSLGHLVLLFLEGNSFHVLTQSLLLL
jgi:hypothetical protein